MQQPQCMYSVLLAPQCRVSAANSAKLGLPLGHCKNSQTMFGTYRHTTQKVACFLLHRQHHTVKHIKCCKMQQTAHLFRCASVRQFDKQLYMTQVLPPFVLGEAEAKSPVAQRCLAKPCARQLCCCSIGLLPCPQICMHQPLGSHMQGLLHHVRDTRTNTQHQMQQVLQHA